MPPAPTTALARQLQDLAAGYRQPQRLRKTSSFLFEDNVAREISREQYNQIGRRGVAALAQLDSRFCVYLDTLFHPQSAELDRVTMAPEQAKETDQRIDEFLWLLGPHFMRPSAHEAIEWLLYQYEAHVFLPEALLRCAIPYHEHLYFIRLVQLLMLSATRWRWLKELQKRGMPLGRQLLVKHMCRDSGVLLTQVIDWMLEAAKRGSAGSPQMNLFVTSVVGVFGQHQGHAKYALTLVLPAAETLISGAVSQDAQAAGVAVICAMSKLVPLTKDLTFRLMTVLCSAIATATAAPGRISAEASPLPAEPLIRALCVVAHGLEPGVQPNQPLSRAMIWQLRWRLPQMVGTLSELQGTAEGRSFARFLLRNMIAQAAGGARSKGVRPRWAENLTALLGELALRPAVASPLAEYCITQVLDAEKGGGEEALLGDTIQALEQRCPEGFDAALRGLLQRAKAGGDSEREGRLFAWLRRHFAGTKHDVVAPDPTGGSGYTLTVACVHHDAGVRRLAARKLLAVTGEGGQVGELAAHMIEGEEDPEVLEELLVESGRKARAVCGAAAYTAAVAALSRRVLPGCRLSPSAAAAVASAAAAAAADAIGGGGHGRKRRRGASPAAEPASAADWAPAVALCCVMHPLLLVPAEGAKTEQQRSAAAAAALAAAADALDGCAPLAGVAKALRATSRRAEALAAAAAQLPAAAAAVYDSALDSQRDPGVLCHLVAAASEAARVEDAQSGTADAPVGSAALFLRLRDRSVAELAAGRSAALPEELKWVSDPAGLTRLASTPAAGQGSAWRLRLLYVGLALRVLTADRAAGLGEEEALRLRADAWTVVAEHAAADTRCRDACLPALTAAAEPPLLAWVWRCAGAPRAAHLTALQCAASKSAPSGANSDARAYGIAALLCYLEREERGGASAEVAALAPAALRRIAGAKAEGVQRTGMERLAVHVADTLPQGLSVADAVAGAVAQHRGRACAGELATCAVAHRMGGVAAVLGSVTALEKLRGLLPLLASLIREHPEAVSEDEALLAAAGVGAFAALLAESTRSRWRELSDRSDLHQLLCLCMQQHEVLRVRRAAPSRWSCLGTAQEDPDAAEGVLSLADLTADALLAPGGGARPGADELLALFDQAEMGQLIDSLVLLAGSGSSASRRLVQALRGQLGRPLRHRAAALAAQHPGDAPAGGKRRRVASGAAAHEALVQCAEMLLLCCHPGGGLPGAGQEPVETAAMAWATLRSMGDESSYLTGVLLSLLANCAEEVAARLRELRPAAEGSAKQRKRPKVAPQEAFPGASWEPQEGVPEMLVPQHGLLLVDIEAYAELAARLRGPQQRKEGVRCLAALAAVHPRKVYEGCVRLAVRMVGDVNMRGAMQEILHGVLPILVHGEAAEEVAALLHVVVYSIASRADGGGAALTECHELLLRCPIEQQLGALTRFLSLQLDSATDGQPAAERDLLKLLCKSGGETRDTAALQLRMLLFALRHLTQSRFLDAVLDAEEAGEGSADGFVDLFVCILRICEENRDGEGSGGEKESDEGSSEAGAAEGEVVPGAAGDGDLHDLSVPLRVRLHQLLEATVDLMPTAVFVSAIQELLGDAGDSLRSLGLRLFNARLAAAAETLSEEETLAFLSMLPDLRDSLAAGGDESALQTALWTLEILARHIAHSHPRSFPHFLPTLAALAAKHAPRVPEAAPCLLLASVALCIGHICYQVEALAVEHLPVFVPPFLKLCAKAAEAAGVGRPPAHVGLLCNALLAAAERVMNRLGEFLSPHYEDLLAFAASRGCAACSDPQRPGAVIDAAHAACERRLLLPAIRKALQRTSDAAVEHRMLWHAAARVVRETPITDLASAGTAAEMVALVQGQLRSYTEQALAQLPVLEALGEAVSALSLKLDETALRGVVVQLQQTAFSHEAEPPSARQLRTLIGFFIIVLRLQDTLGGIFAVIYKVILAQGCELLGQLQGAFPSWSGPVRRLAATCAVVVLQSLRILVDTDDDGEVSKSQELTGLVADAAVRAITAEELLGHELALPLDGPGGERCEYDERCAQLLRPLLARLCNDCQDRGTWNRVQKGLLRAHRTSSGPPRRAALETLRGLYEDCGEDFAGAMVAEVLQPLSEALDDEDDAVSTVAQSFVSVASRLTGEDISRYMRGEK
eukprot:TRINITY_DN1300_c2_g4_i1.p1 TRINITY_DN1300_c2_g4~~TRINITY_DN1300_c2_g4_i1.p1  ORF type:complete len:2144 (+),score=760.96 TRINITY_DN1300_c2_g4_i1:94-6525(+)